MEPVISSIREIFADAAEIADPAARSAFLDSVCRGDRLLRERIERLCDADSSARNFLKPAGDTTTGDVIWEKPGDRIGRYRLIERIGRGGGGVVYLAEQEEPVRRRVALKILKPGMDTESVVARFEAERQALALMDHPNIARVLDAGSTEKGRPFFVMELVSGLPLSDYCRQKQPSLRERLELFIQVCNAVQHAHQKGIIHRDLKPSNILVTEAEGVLVPKVIDFGIAKAVEEGLDENGLTSVNLFLGTPAYMSPEQVNFGGRDIDTRSDIYSLGVILYELLVGQPPFQPKELVAAGLEEMRRIIREVDPPRPSTTITRNLRLPQLPATRVPPCTREQIAALRGDLDWVVMKCLEKERARRYETANGLAMDLRRHLNHEPVLARPPTQLYKVKKLMRRHQLVFAATAMVSMVLIAAVLISTQSAVRARRAEHEQARLRTLAESNAMESRQRLVRRYVAEANRLTEENLPILAFPWMVQALRLESGEPQREEDERLRLAQAEIGAPQLKLHLAQGKSVDCVALSPDGSLVASGSEDGVLRISQLQSGRTNGSRVTLPGSVRTVRFSPDGTKVIAMDSGGNARVWAAATGEPITPVMKADDFDPASVADLTDGLRPEVAFSPDGELLLIAWGSLSAQLRDAQTGRLLHSLTHGAVVYHAAFSHDGRLAVTSSRDGTARVWDLATGTGIGQPLQHTGRVVWSQFNSDGSKVLTVRDRHFVQLWDWREARRLAPEIPRRSVLSHASLSSDDKHILTVAWSGYGHLYDAASSQRVEQFTHQGGLVDAAFSPDNRHVAIACHDGNVWLWDLDDPARRPMALPSGNNIEQIAFNRDGTMLAVGARGGHSRVWQLFPPQNGVSRLPGSDVQWVAFDHSGKRALLVNTEKERGISVFEVSTGSRIWTVTNQVRRASFSPDDGRILAGGSGAMVYVLDARSGRESIPPIVHKPRVLDAVWTVDGELVLTAAGAGGVQAWDSATGRLKNTFADSKPVRAMALSSEGASLALCTEDNSVEFFDAKTGRRQGSLPAVPDSVQEVRFSPDSKWIALVIRRADGEGSVEIRNVLSGALSGRPLRHRDRIMGIEFSRDGALLATACDDHSARVWNTANGEPLTPWLRQDFEGREVLFSPDGRRLATLARRGAVRLWNASTGEPITPPISYHRNSGDGGVSYSPDGQRLLIARGGNEAWLRELKPETRELEQLVMWAEVLTCTRFDPAAGMVPLDEAGLNLAWAQLQAKARIP